MSRIENYIRNLSRSEYHRNNVEEQIGQARELVDRGEAYLTDHFGHDKWKEEINPDHLAMGSMCNCVFGQLFGSFPEADNELGDYPLSSFDAGEVDFGALTVAWIEKLTGEEFEPEYSFA